MGFVLATKDETFKIFKKYYKRITNLKGQSVISIRSDHGTEFENQFFDHFCSKHRIDHNFSAPRTPQQDGVAERKNRTLKEIARTMLYEENLSRYFWTKAVNTTCYILNHVSTRPIIKKTPYETWNEKKSLTTAGSATTSLPLELNVRLPRKTGMLSA